LNELLGRLPIERDREQRSFTGLNATPVDEPSALKKCSKKLGTTGLKAGSMIYNERKRLSRSDMNTCHARRRII